MAAFCASGLLRKDCASRSATPDCAGCRTGTGFRATPNSGHEKVTQTDHIGWSARGGCESRFAFLLIAKSRGWRRALSIEIPFPGRFQHSRAELIADGIVHAVGIVLAISAGSILLAFSIFHAGVWEYVAA